MSFLPTIPIPIPQSRTKKVNLTKKNCRYRNAKFHAQRLCLFISHRVNLWIINCTRKFSSAWSARVPPHHHQLGNRLLNKPFCANWEPWTLGWDTPRTIQFVLVAAMCVCFFFRPFIRQWFTRYCWVGSYVRLPLEMPPLRCGAEIFVVYSITFAIVPILFIVGVWINYCGFQPRMTTTENYHCDDWIRQRFGWNSNQVDEMESSSSEVVWWECITLYCFVNLRNHKLLYFYRSKQLSLSLCCYFIEYCF